MTAKKPAAPPIKKIAPAEPSYNPFATTQQFDRIAGMLGLTDRPGTCSAIPCANIISASVHGQGHPFFRGFRVSTTMRGPCRDRFHPMETVDTIRALAMLMTWKCR